MDVVEEVIEKLGGVKAAQAHFNYTEPMAIYNWRSRGLPYHLLIDIHQATGIPLDRLKNSRKK